MDAWRAGLCLAYLCCCPVAVQVRYTGLHFCIPNLETIAQSRMKPKVTDTSLFDLVRLASSDGPHAKKWRLPDLG